MLQIGQQPEKPPLFGGRHAGLTHAERRLQRGCPASFHSVPRGRERGGRGGGGVSGRQEVTYGLDVGAGKKNRRKKKAPLGGQEAEHPIPRVARLMALAIRFEGLLRDETIRDYAELARLGRVTRARITQIMQLLHLAPDIQERILFLPTDQGLHERNLRSIVSRIDWDEQRRMFQTITDLYLERGGVSA